MRRYSGNLASKSAVKAVISQELGKISRLAKENNWGKRKIQKEIRMLQSEVEVVTHDKLFKACWGNVRDLIS